MCERSFFFKLILYRLDADKLFYFFKNYRNNVSNSVFRKIFLLRAAFIQIDLSMEFHYVIDDFRGACAVKGNVQVAGRTSSVSTRRCFQRMTLR